MLMYIVAQFVEMYENESTKAATLDMATKVNRLPLLVLYFLLWVVVCNCSPGPQASEKEGFGEGQ